MADAAERDYRQSDIIGKKWRRSLHVECNNPYGGPAWIRFDEEDRVILSDGNTMGTPAGSVTKHFVDPSATFAVLDPANGVPTGQTCSHGQLYALLWSLYMDSVAERDAAELELLEQQANSDARFKASDGG